MHVDLINCMYPLLGEHDVTLFERHRKRRIVTKIYNYVIISSFKSEPTSNKTDKYTEGLKKRITL